MRSERARRVSARTEARDSERPGVRLNAPAANERRRLTKELVSCLRLRRKLLFDSFAVTGPRLCRGDRVKVVSPASFPAREDVMRGAAILEAWGLRVEFGAHAFDRLGHYLAGRDADRLADMNGR